MRNKDFEKFGAKTILVSIECDQIWRNFATKMSGNFMRVCLVFGKNVFLLWQIFYTILKIFKVVNANNEN